jgi:hypothetical protein
LAFIFDKFEVREKIESTAAKVFNYSFSILDNLDSTGVIDIGCDQNIPNSICDFDDVLGYNCSNLSDTKDAVCGLLQNIDDPNLQTSLMEAVGIGVDDGLNMVSSFIADHAADAAEGLYPEELWMLTVPLGFGLFVSVFTAFQLAMRYIPSVTTTIIQLRTGDIPSLGDKDNFKKYRVAPDTVTLLTGTLFWGCLVSSIMTGLIVAIVVFALFWQATRQLIQKLVVILFAMIIIIVVRTMLVYCCKVAFFKGLYRKRPAGANISFLSLDWANYYLTILTVIVRVIKILIAAFLAVGMIDRPFLANGVGQIGSMELDPYPTIHTRELIANEAHRHPYIETLGVMYLMKLRYANDFGHRAGSAWRLIFIYALMPWFHHYRIRDSDSSIVPPALEAEEDGELEEANKRAIDSHKLYASESKLGNSLVSLSNTYDGVTGKVNKDLTKDYQSLEAENRRLKRLVKKLKKSKRTLSTGEIETQ